MAGKTVEEATEHALYELGVAAADAEVVVLSEPKVGLFGRLKEEARVQARVRPVGARPKRERSRDRGRRSGQGGERPSRGSRASSGQRGSQAQAGSGGGGGAESAKRDSDRGARWRFGRHGGGRGRPGHGAPPTQTGSKFERMRRRHRVAVLVRAGRPAGGAAGTEPRPWRVRTDRGGSTPRRGIYLQGGLDPPRSEGGDGSRERSTGSSGPREGDGRHGRGNDTRGAG